MDKLLAIKTFMATVEARGFSAAARKLGVATSSVTRLVDALESELGPPCSTARPVRSA